MIDSPLSFWLVSLIACGGLMAPPADCPTAWDDAQRNAWMDPDIVLHPDSSVPPSMPTYRPQQSADPEMVQPVRPPAVDISPR